MGPIGRVDRDWRRCGVGQVFASLYDALCVSSVNLMRCAESLSPSSLQLILYLIFHNKSVISTPKNSRNPLAFCKIRSMLQINGREIFQKERADKELSGEPATGLRRCSGN